MNRFTKYKTEPLSCWGKAKELRVKYFKDLAQAREKGQLIVAGGSEGLASLPAGLGDYIFFAGEPYAASIGADESFCLECCEAVESRGFARDLCGYMRNFWGSMFLNKYLFGGEFPRPDLCIQLHSCDTHAKWFQGVAEYYNVPYFCVDWPVSRIGDWRERNINYIVAQLNESIEGMEKALGRKYDDEKLIEACRNEFLSTSLFAEICTLNKAIPAPLDHKTLFSLFVISVMMKQCRESVEFYRELRDEVKYRVENEIAAVPTERCRLLDDNEPPWFFLKLFRHLEKYGAVTLGSHHTFFLAGAFEDRPDGTLGPRRTPYEKGEPLKTREDALRALAHWYLDRPLIECTIKFKTDMLLRMVKEWKVNAVILHFNRGCEGIGQGVAEDRLGLSRAGIPVIAYEGNMIDKREFDISQVLDRMDSFMESLGLTLIN